MGNRYWRHDDEKDPEFGKKYFETLLRATEVGDVESMREVGRMYLKGEDVEQNIDEGMKWLQRAAENGNVEALIIMGNHFATQDKDKAIDLLTKAANLGNMKAIKKLIYLYEQPEYDEFYELLWLDNSAALGNLNSLSKLAEFYRNIAHIPGNLPQSDMKALEYSIKAAEVHGFASDDIKFVTKIYNKYYKFTDKKVFKYYLTTEKLGQFNAMFGIAAKLYKEDHSERSYRLRALKWYKMAADAGDYDAAVAMTYILSNDEVVPSSVYSEHYHEALYWYERTAEFGNINAAKNLVMLYRDGYRSHLPNREKSMYWLEKVLEMEGGNKNV